MIWEKVQAAMEMMTAASTVAKRSLIRQQAAEAACGAPANRKCRAPVIRGTCQAVEDARDPAAALVMPKRTRLFPLVA
jgi:hypothetical protein